MQLYLPFTDYNPRILPFNTEKELKNSKEQIDTLVKNYSEFFSLQHPEINRASLNDQYQELSRSSCFGIGSKEHISMEETYNTNKELNRFLDDLKFARTWHVLEKLSKKKFTNEFSRQDKELFLDIIINQTLTSLYRDQISQPGQRFLHTLLWDELVIKFHPLYGDILPSEIRPYINNMRFWESLKNDNLVYSLEDVLQNYQRDLDPTHAERGMQYLKREGSNNYTFKYLSDESLINLGDFLGRVASSQNNIKDDLMDLVAQYTAIAVSFDADGFGRFPTSKDPNYVSLLEVDGIFELLETPIVKKAIRDELNYQNYGISEYKDPSFVDDVLDFIPKGRSSFYNDITQYPLLL